MADTNANIAVTVGGDTSQLRSDLKKAGRSLDSFEQRADKAAKKIAVVAAAAASAGAAMVTALFNKQRQVIDSLAKTADALGVTTENLQAMQHMAGLAGVESDQLNKSIQRMQKGLGEAARKGGVAADALADVGISIDDILSMSADDQLIALSKAFGEVENHTIKASLASDVFGRNGLKMLKVLDQLEKEGLQPTIESLDAMGASISRIDAQSVEDANDALEKAGEAAKGLANELTVALAPIVEAVANSFTEWVKESGGLKKALEKLKPALDAIVVVGKTLAVIYGIRMVGALANFTKNTIISTKATLSQARAMGVAAIAAKGFSRAMMLLGGPAGIILTAVTALGAWAISSKSAEKDTDDLSESVKVLDRNLVSMSSTAAKVALLDIGKPLNEASKAAREAEASMFPATRGLESLNNEIERLKSLQLKQATGGFNDLVLSTQNQIDDLQSEIPDIQATFDRKNLILEEAINKEKELLDRQKALKEIAAGNSLNGESDNSLVGQERKDFELRNEQMQGFIENREQQMLDLRMLELKAFDDSLIDQQSAMEAKFTSQKEFNRKDLMIHKEAVDKSKKLDKLRASQSVSLASQMFGNLSTLMGSESKKLFKIGKAAAIAQAAIDGIASAVASYKFGASIGGPLLGGIAAAASGVATGAMISQIKGQQFGGGGSTTPNVNAGGGGAIAAATTNTPQNQSSGGDAGGSAGGTLTVQGLDAGALFTGDAVSGLAEELLEYQRNGGRVVLQA